MSAKIAIVIPCYRVRDSIIRVVQGSLAYADMIFCVDDACPDNSGQLVEQEIHDPKVTVLFNSQNLGVGGAVKAGYAAALEANCDVVIKLDGDGQMDPRLIPALVQPILDADSDYCKGNRFHELQGLKDMPLLRLFGNSVLSLLTKLSSGYWQTLDPTNGFTAIGSQALKAIPLSKVSNGYFFESDMLFRLNVARAVVTDIPMHASYGDETSNLRISRVLGPFLLGNLRNLFKRIFYNYFLRDFNIATVQLLIGFFVSLFGLVSGINAWSQSIDTGITASAGTVMLSALPVIIGFQLLLSFLNYDFQNVPRRALGKFKYREPGN